MFLYSFFLELTFSIESFVWVKRGKRKKQQIMNSKKKQKKINLRK